MTFLILLRRFWWALPILGLVAALFVTRGTLADVRKAYALEQAAHRQTIANYRAAAEARKASDLANVQRVNTAQANISREISDDYATRLASVRADFAERVRHATQGNTGGPGGADLPGPGTTARRVDEAAGEAKLPLKDALIASEQAEQLIALQAWVRGVSGMDMNGTVPAP